MTWATERASTLPHSVLYLSPPEVAEETITDAWQAHGNPLSLDLTRFDEVVDRLYKGGTNEGQSTYASSEQRRWIVEAALQRIDETSNPLYTEGEPTVGLVEQAMDLLTLLEFAGLESPAQVKTRLQTLGVQELVDPLSEFFRHVFAVRADAFSSELTFRGERYLHVIQQSEALIPDILDTTDVVVLGAFQTLSPLERDLLAELQTTFDTAVITPKVTETATPTGVDRAISKISGWYDSLGFESQDRRIPDERPTNHARSQAARRLYRYQDTTEDQELETDLTLRSFPTVQHEVVGITRQIRSLIADGVPPEEICVAAYDPDTYATRLANRLASADVPISYDTEYDFFETTIGTLFEAALDLGTEPNRVEPLEELLSNPLVTPSEAVSTADITDTAARLESTQVETLQSHLADPQVTVVETVIAACETFTEQTSLDRARRELLDSLGVPVDDDGLALVDHVTLCAKRERIESSALHSVARVCDSLDTVETVPTTEELRRALDQVSVETTVGRRSNSVRIGSPTEAISNPYSHVFVPGLTSEHTPDPVRRLAFARTLNDAHQDFAAADPIRRTRYTFGILLTSEVQLRLSAPEQNANGDPYVPADVLSELQRITATDLSSESTDVPAPATCEDVHRSLATALETGSRDPETVGAAADSYDIEVAEANPRQRLENGIRAAAARSEHSVGQFDGRISQDVVQQFRTEGAPFSPSSLERYAGCGFKFYMRSLLDIEAEEEITIELNSLDVGTYIHDVLEAFYREWVDRGYDGVSDNDIDDAQSVLYDVAVQLLDELDTTETVFHEDWTASLFDGLDVANNQLGDPAGPPGLFRRFLTAEADLDVRAARPSAFEANIGLGEDNPSAHVVSKDAVPLDGSDVSLHGKIDRVDLTADGGIVAYDYKTGGTPSESDTLDGHRFQLPAYLLMAEAAFDGEAIGASYYQVNPSSSVSFHAGTIGAEADASHYYSQSADPLQRVRSLEFETRDEFQEFLHTDVAERIEDIATAVRAGSFHPTVLDPDEAGCEHCDYRDACDVRHHQRHEVRKTLTADDLPHYIPTSWGAEDE
jgi:ATP-dependent helicase/nuclease subunit B